MPLSPAGNTRNFQPIRTVTIAALALIAVHLATLISGYGKPGGWIMETAGRARANEYTGVRAAGVLAREGRAADAYDIARHQAKADAIIGHVSDARYPWPYPPTYLFVAMALASLSLPASALGWIALTLAGYLVTVGMIARLRVAAVWAAAAPATLINAMTAHTGFWTAGVFGYGVLALTTRPVLAGICFGLLTMKPQLGLLVPIALIAGGHWRALVAASATALTLIGVSVAAFGIEPWMQFPWQLERIAAIARNGQIPLDMLVTIYGFLRFYGLSDAGAMGAQIALTLVLAAGIITLWRSKAPEDLKAAGLISASLLATPYLFIYDLTLLAIVAAFLIRHTGLAGFKPAEAWAMIAAMAALLVFAVSPVPVGFVANVGMAGVVLGRVWPHLASGGLRLAGRPRPATS